MPKIQVSSAKPGDRLLEDVITKFGSVLLQKNRTLTARDIDVLNAFLISTIDVQRSGETEPVQEQKADAPAMNEAEKPFHEAYDQLLQLLKKFFRIAESNGVLPVIEIRKSLEQVLSHIDQYHLLSFVPRQFQTKDYLYHNSIQVALTSYQIAKSHGLPSKDWVPVALAGLLHDIGNMRIDRSILEKPGKLTKDELEEMRKHTLYGYQILKPIAAFNDGIKLSALQHHEKEDGSGYPMGLKGDKLHPYAKIIAVADIYHAMTSDRSHKKADSPYLVLEQLYKESFGKLDPYVVQTFLNKVTQVQNGVMVRLSDGRIGEIIFTNRDHPTRPMVNANGTIINLAIERNLYIETVLPKI
ncbi:HD-GYP domain-containing protein [Paenibacillus thermoaerophilus]|uniref:HD-GYP domain-containing protein n=1 Tax=Paenibacillus thermoaerophilus TaxID=1215385 RepID=A0ABW2V1M4_9BACL|nr:HD-GYP domain-containing protein [Paenibacillus thermoaerophilus]TMV06670.1 HD-GYP domain-containing protein [Paenibacillus thermoaerophilus]